MSQVDAHVHIARASHGADAPSGARPPTEAQIEAERYWTMREYGLALGETERWVRDHANGRYPALVLVHSRVGGSVKFSAADRAENARRMAVRPTGPEEREQPGGLQLPSDPRDLARLLDEVRRVSA